MENEVVDVFAPTLEKIRPTAQRVLPGVPVTIGTRVYLVPRLTAGQLKLHAEAIKKLSSIAEDADPVEVINTAIPVIACAIARNYPEYTAEELEENIEIGAPFFDVVRALMGQAGYRATPPGEK